MRMKAFQAIIECVDLLRNEHFLEKPLKIRRPIIASSRVLAYLNNFVREL